VTGVEGPLCGSRAKHAIPVKFEGRRRTSPKRGSRGNVLTKSAAVMSYGDLNGGKVVRRVDHGDACDGSLLPTSGDHTCRYGGA
jgi:hypothetical protein